MAETVFDALLQSIQGFLGSAGYAALVALGVWVTLLAVTFAYEGRKPGLFLIDGLYHLVAFAVGGAILGLF